MSRGKKAFQEAKYSEIGNMLKAKYHGNQEIWFEGGNLKKKRIIIIKKIQWGIKFYNKRIKNCPLI